jgi:predicted GNAT family acetyltransferase
LTERLVRRLTTGIQQLGERPFLHVSSDNTGARRLYERLGFQEHALVRVHGYRTPAR